MSTGGKTEEQEPAIVVPEDAAQGNGMGLRDGLMDGSGTRGRRSRSRNRYSRRRRSRSRTSSETSTAAPSSLSEGDSTETDTSGRRKSGRKRKNKPNLYSVLKSHTTILKELTSVVRRLEADNENLRTDNQNRRLENVANSLSNTSLRSAIEEERGREHRPIDVEELEIPKLSRDDCPAAVFNKALQSFHSSYRTMANGKDSHSVRELYQLVAATAETNKFSRRQFYQAIRSRVVLDSPLGEYVREAIRKDTGMKRFARGLRIYFGRDETYLSALKRYQEFTGSNLSAKEFLVQLRSVSAGLIENQPGGPGTPESDEQALLAHMREKLFGIMPTLAETILNRERSGRAPADSYEFGELLDRYRLSIEANLKGRRRQTVHTLDGDFGDTVTVSDTAKDVGRSADGGELDMVNYSVDMVQEKTRAENKPTKAKTLKLTKSQLEDLRNKCYKCASKSPIQDGDHRSATCLLYKGRALASYVCSHCKLGVHLPSDCLQADDRIEGLRKRAEELDLPIRLEDNVVVNLIEDHQKN